MSKKKAQNKDWNNSTIHSIVNGKKVRHDANIPMAEKIETHNQKRTPALRYTLIALLLIILTIYIGISWSSKVTISKVNIFGNFYTSNDEILQTIHLSDTIWLDSLDIPDLIKTIEQMPYIKKAAVEPNPPHSINIIIRERQPLALLLNGDSQAYVDKEGIKLPVIPGLTPRVPILYGFSSNIGDTLKPDIFNVTSRFLSNLSTMEIAHATLSEIAFTPTDGIVAMSRENGVKIIFGRENPESRLLNWQAFYQQIIPKKGITTFNEIDLRYRGQIITKES